MSSSKPDIIMYTSSFCGHSWAVERFLKENKVPVKLVNIDKNPKARKKVMDLNRGYASVPTLIFPDGLQLTEPSFSELRSVLGIERRGILDRLGGLFGRDA